MSLKGRPVRIQGKAVWATLGSRLHPGDVLPSIKDICKEFGVASPTASHFRRTWWHQGLVDKIAPYGCSVYVVTPVSNERRQALVEEWKAAKREVASKSNALSKGRSEQVRQVAATSKELRRRLRDSLLQVVVNEGLDQHLARAIRDGDRNRMDVIERAVKLVGGSWEQSEEAVALVEKHAAAATATALASIAIAFKPATGPSDTIKTMYTEVEVVDENQAGSDN